MEILWKGTVSAQFRAIRPKLCGNCAFPQNLHTRKLGEITVFFGVFPFPSLSASASSSSSQLFCLSISAGKLLNCTLKIYYKQFHGNKIYALAGLNLI